VVGCLRRMRYRALRRCVDEYIVVLFYFFFFFQAEDGIRDRNVTGVQTCALPICRTWNPAPCPGNPSAGHGTLRHARVIRLPDMRSEERRVGKECRARRAACQSKKKESGGGEAG